MFKRKGVASLVGGVLIAQLAMPISAAVNPADALAVAQKMNVLGVVQGAGTLPNGQPDFRLEAQISRAELVTTLVRSFGLESSAQLAKGAPSFADVQADAWYSGYVAVAKNLADGKQIPIGRSERLFDPEAPVTRAEALTFVLKFLGINATSASEPWYGSWIQQAMARGVLTTTDAASLLADPAGAATRGEAFMILDKGYSAKVLTDSKSLYTTYVDQLGPSVTLVQPPATTTQAEITLTGAVTDNKGLSAFYLNGRPLTLVGTSFSIPITLSPGANQLELRAVDLAGNETSQVVTVVRGAAEPASISIAPLRVPAGTTVTVTPVVMDAMGVEIPGVEVTGTATVGSYTNGQFTAPTTLVSGTLTLKTASGISRQVPITIVPGPVAKVSAPHAVAPGEQVELTATDAYGNAVTGAVFSQSSPDALLTEDGRFVGSAPKTYTVRATKDGVTAEGQVGVYGEPKALRFMTGARLVANDSSTGSLQVEVVDANGIRVANYGQKTADERITIVAPFGLIFTSSQVKPTNGVATFQVKADPSLAGTTVTLTAEFASNGNVRGTGEITIEEQAPSAIRIEAPEVLRVNSSTPSEVTVELLDQGGKPITTGAYDLTVRVEGAATLPGGQRTDTLDWTPLTKTFEIVPVDAATTGPITLTVSGPGLTEAKATLNAQIATAPTALRLNVVGANSVGALHAFDAGVASVAAAAGRVLRFDASVVDSRGVPVDQNSARVALRFTGVTDPAAMWISLDGVLWVDLATYHPANDLLTMSAGKATFYVIASQPNSFQVRATEYQDGAGGYTEIGLSDSGAVSATIAAGRAALARFAAGSTLTLLRGSPTRGDVVVQLTDRVGNPVRQSGVTVTVSATPETVQLNGDRGDVSATTDANGRAVFTLQASAALDEVTLRLTELSWNGGTVTVDPLYNELVVKAEYQLPKSLNMAIKKDGVLPSTIAAGEPFTVEVTVLDQDRQPYDLLSASDLRLKLDGKVQPITAQFNGDGVYTFEVPAGMLYRGGNASVEVEVVGQTSPVTANRTLSVRAGAPASIRLAEAIWTDNGNNQYELSDSFSVRANRDQAKAYTLQVVDQYGNMIVPSSLTSAVTVGLSGTASSGGYLIFTDAAGVPLSSVTVGAGRNTTTFYARSDKGGTMSLSSGFGTLTVTLSVP